MLKKRRQKLELSDVEIVIDGENVFKDNRLFSIFIELTDDDKIIYTLKNNDGSDINDFKILDFKKDENGVIKKVILKHATEDAYLSIEKRKEIKPLINLYPINPIGFNRGNDETYRFF